MTDGPECALCFDSVQVDGTGEEDRLAMLNYLAGLPALSVSLAGLPALSWFISVIARDGVSLHLIAPPVTLIAVAIWNTLSMIDFLSLWS